MTSTVMLSSGSVIVDECDMALVRQHRWHVRPNGYVVRFAKRDGNVRTIYLHREIMGATAEEEVDHIDGNPNNNSRANLRRCSRSENGRNTRGSTRGTSPFKGVSFERWTGKWRAIIHVGERHLNLGRFVNEEDAAR